MEHIMHDLETFGRSPGCAVASIGAVAFDRVTGETGQQFYVVVNYRSCQDLGLHVDPDTMAWWKKQSPEAREVLKLTSLKTKSVPLPEALRQFTEFVRTVGTKSKVKIWGNGADFDNAIMAVCYAACNMEYPIEFWNNRCHRTFKNEAPHIKVPRTGTYHNALDDAISQAAHHTLIHQALYGGVDPSKAKTVRPLR